MAISVGTPFTIDTDSPDNGIKSARLTDTKIIVGYMDGDVFGDPTAVIVENDETVGTPFAVNSSGLTRPYIVGLSATKALMCWRGSGGPVGFRALTISGTTITAPGAVLVPFSSASGRKEALVNLTSTNSLFIFIEGSTTTAVVMSVSGDTVTEESGGALTGWAADDWTVVGATALSSTKVLVCYDQPDSSNRGMATILNISGTTVSDGGVDTVFEAGHTNAISVSALSSTAAIVTYSDADDSDHGKAQVITVSGSTPTANTPLTYQAATVNETGVAAFDSANAAVISEGPDQITELLISGTAVTKGDESAVTITGDVWATAFDSAALLATYVGSAEGVIVDLLAGATHIWLSTDGGATYTDIGDSAWGASVVGGVVVVPGTAYQTIFAAVGTSLYKTTNGGTAWTLEVAITYEVDFISLEKDNATVFMTKRDAAGTNRASLWDGSVLTHINTGKSTTGGATSGGDVV